MFLKNVLTTRECSGRRREPIGDFPSSLNDNRLTDRPAAMEPSSLGKERRIPYTGRASPTNVLGVVRRGIDGHGCAQIAKGQERADDSLARSGESAIHTDFQSFRRNHGVGVQRSGNRTTNPLISTANLGPIPRQTRLQHRSWCRWATIGGRRGTNVVARVSPLLHAGGIGIFRARRSARRSGGLRA